MRRVAVLLLLFLAASLGSSARTTPGPRQTGTPSLVGDWVLVFTPFQGQFSSRLGNTLGFADRNINFADDRQIRTATVTREDLGPDVRPLGVWRLNGDQLSATFELWCPDPNGFCGTITLRGSFNADGNIIGLGTVFFEVEDDTRPTGLDTWVMQFTGSRVGG